MPYELVKQLMKKVMKHVGRLPQTALIIGITATIVTVSAAAPIPEDFPRFGVPGHEKEMASLQALYWLHYEPGGPLIPLWDEWEPRATLWPALGAESGKMRERWARALAGRIIDPEGYVLTQQHDGPAHAEGWPFPQWMEAGGIGWHFRGTGVPGYEPPAATPAGWAVAGGKGGEVNEKGWVVELNEAQATAQRPAFAIEAKNAPWLRLNGWAAGLEGANCYVEWATKEQPEFSAARRAYFSPAASKGEPHSYLPMGPPRAVELNTNVSETRT